MENFFIHIYNIIAETVYFYFLNVSNLEIRTIHRSEKHLGICNNVNKTQAINNYNQLIVIYYNSNLDYNLV